MPEIKKSPAYKDGGMIAITFDQAPQTGEYADPSACCASPAAYPNLRGLPPGTPVPPAGATGPGGCRATTTEPRPRADRHDDRPGTTTTTDDHHPDRHNRTAPTTTTAPLSLGTGETTPTGGGGQVGLLLISRYVKANTIDVIDYFNHFSLLATIENMFGLHRLGYSGAPGLPVFSTSVFNNYSGG